MHSILKLVIRLMVVSAFIQIALNSLSYISQMIYMSRSDPQTFVQSYVPFLVAFALGALGLSIIWWKTEWLTRILVGRVEQDALVINLSNNEILRLVLHIIGYILVFKSVPAIIGIVSYYIYYSKLTAGSILDEFQASDLQRVVTLVVTVVTGVVLIFWNEKLKGWFVSILDTIDKPEDNTDKLDQ